MPQQFLLQWLRILWNWRTTVGLTHLSSDMELTRNSCVPLYGCQSGCWTRNEHQQGPRDIEPMLHGASNAMNENNASLQNIVSSLTIQTIIPRDVSTSLLSLSQQATTNLASSAPTPTSSVSASGEPKIIPQSTDSALTPKQSITIDGSCGSTYGGVVCGDWSSGSCCSMYGVSRPFQQVFIRLIFLVVR